jgi:putative peptide zinc metalloprotease protein
MMVALAIVKVFHELGHALTCKHFGGEVHELGLMLLAFTPCLYCDVSDAYQLPDRRKRILISAAGILVEFVLAALAVIVWWFSQPGIVNLVALNIVLISTVSTLVVNGNPLLRYDGYYILSDLTETPNLWQRSRQVLGDFGRRWLLGLKTTADAITPSRHDAWLAMYGVASKVYMTLVMIGIVWMLVQFLHPFHLQNVAYGLGLVVAGSALAGPVMGTTRLVRNPLRRREVRSGRLALVLLVALVGVGLLMRLPVTYSVSAPLVLMPQNAQRIYATVDGTLRSAATMGKTVQLGDEIIRLESSHIEHEVERLDGERRLRAMRLEHLLALRSADPSANAEIPATRAALAAVEDQLADRRRKADRLQLTAPVAGTVLPVPAVFDSHEPTGQLADWSGSLLDEANRGAHVAAGTLVCWVGDARALEAVVLVDDTEAPRVAPGQRVRLELDALPAEVVWGEVIEIARRDSTAPQLDGAADAPLEQLTAGLFPAGRDATRYHVRVAFDTLPAPLVPGTRGTARIATEPMPLGRHTLRWLAQTFRVPI